MSVGQTSTGPAWTRSILSEVNSDFVSNPFPALDESVRVSLRVAATAPLARVFLRTVLAGESRLRAMRPDRVERGWSWYKVDLTICQQRVAWHFVLETLDGNYFIYNRNGVCRYSASADGDFSIIANLACPHWVRSAVFYQIFPDRFFCASPEDAVSDGEYQYDGWPARRMAWSTPPHSWNEVHCLDFYGGDLDGIEAKISYLQHLGVSALYLNPIFSASSTHRYDCVDYFQVDPHLGGNAALESLSAALHAAGLKLIVDVSINHTGSEHRWLQAAQDNPAAAERDFYYFDELGRASGWEGVPTLPQLNYASTELRRRIWLDEDALVRYWLKPPYAIDGWRFDVGNFTGRHSAADFNRLIFSGVRQAVKEISTEAYILGECWIDAREYLEGDCWDAAMNYQASGRIIRRFLGCRDRFTDPEERMAVPVPPLDGQELAAALTHYYGRLPSQLAFVQFNLLDSHDIYRLHNFESLVNENVLRGALILLYLLPGAPCVYYGDEIGIAGDMSTNEGCRYPMPWDESCWNRPRLELYRQLNQLKREEPALHDGALRFLFASEDTVVVARIGLRRSFIGLFSRAASIQTIELDLSPLSLEPVTVTDLFSGEVLRCAAGTCQLESGSERNSLFVVDHT